MYFFFISKRSSVLFGDWASIPLRALFGNVYRFGMRYINSGSMVSCTKSKPGLLDSLEDASKRLDLVYESNLSLSIGVEQVLHRISPELAIDYEEIEHRAAMGSIKWLGYKETLSLNYGSAVSGLVREARDAVNENEAGKQAEVLLERIKALTKELENRLQANERLAKQIISMPEDTHKGLFIYSESDLDSVTRSYINDEHSELRKTLSKYALDLLVINVSNEDMMPNGLYSRVMLRYKTFASLYTRMQLDEDEYKRVELMARKGELRGLIREYVSGTREMLNVNIIPRRFRDKYTIELASETYYCEDYNLPVQRAHEMIMHEILP